jgi:cyclopropane fatty-acyl-phospholipid synthase-like methyltransferase
MKSAHQGSKWDKEYSKDKGILSTVRTQPSEALTKFFDHYQPKIGRALDIGSGKGRNTVHLAKLGYDVVGLEVSEVALSQAIQHRGVTYLKQDLAQPWLVGDEEFDLAIDMMAFHLLDSKGRANYLHELKRALKPGAMFVMFTVSDSGKWVEESLRDRPGPESGAYIIPDSGMVEKAFSIQELKNLFAFLKPLEMSEQDYNYKFYNQDITIRHITAVMEKPESVK